ncbi:Os09g0555900 [Oryza sativa Japonica Group]|uniref:Os09g0555900 protein n=1 Tax=Oryza sativa subsp. japonica TaxID=39947 RepID=A0A0N7KR90_ORYSJ|nr:hypothetical protein DAI22_09g194100 [Oryza sativa Japonica Group]BAT09354.1 Os09g0555900 [Oryza sativa Japonica Group]
MARAANRRRRRGGVVYAVVLDDKEGSLVFRFRRKDLFSDDDDPPPAGRRRFPRPVAHFPRGYYHYVFHSFTVSGKQILGVSPFGATVVIEDDGRPGGSGAMRAGPELGTTTCQPILLPIREDMVLVMAYLPQPAGRSNFAVMRRLPDGGGGGGGWRVVPVPEPPLGGPGDYYCRKPAPVVTAYMTIGRRACVSIAGEGTFSLDAGGAAAWRKEGSWELPLHGQAMYVRELGAAIGLGRGPGPYGGVVLWLCACDVEARPPVIRRSWNETFPRELVAAHSQYDCPGNLVYVGDGRFCICWVAGVEHDRPETNDMVARTAVVTMAVRLRRSAGGELQLTKLRYHLMSPQGRRAYFVQPHIP